MTYPLAGSPIDDGTNITISRVLDLTQDVSVSNQGPFYPQAVEQALDILEMQIQQIAARTGQFRGEWATATDYNYGDIVLDGANGEDSDNYYMCVIANTSTVWSTDIAAGDWVIFIQSTLPVATLPLSIANGGTGQTSAGAALTALGGIGLASSNAYLGANNFTGGSITVTTQTLGNSSTFAASTAFVAAALANLGAANLTNGVTGSGAIVLATAPTITNLTVDRMTVTGSSAPTNGIYLPAANTVGIASGGFPIMTFVTAATAVNYLTATASAAASPVLLQPAGSDTNINLSLISKAAGEVHLATGSSTNIQMVISHVASCVNPIFLAGGVAGGSTVPTIGSTGSDTNVGLNVVAKGTGTIGFYTAAGSTKQFEIANVTSAVNYHTFAGAVLSGSIAWGASGSDTNINMSIIAKGTGNLIVPSVWANASTATAVHVDSNGLLRKTASSRRYKENIRDYTKGVTDLLALMPKLFNEKSDPSHKDLAGLIAEEVADAGLEEFVCRDQNFLNRPEAVHYPNLVALLINCVKELHARLESVESITNPLG